MRIVEEGSYFIVKETPFEDVLTPPDEVEHGSPYYRDQLAWVWPAVGYQPLTIITSPYGDTAGRTYTHTGLDTGIPFGTKLAAPISGTLRIVNESTQGWGRYLEICNGEYCVQLSHLSEFDQNAIALNGGWVDAGTTLAYSGGATKPGQTGYDPSIPSSVTGNSTGPHLDIQVKKNGSYVDPAMIFGGAWTNESNASGAVNSGTTNGDTPEPGNTADCGKQYNFWEANYWKCMNGDKIEETPDQPNTGDCYRLYIPGSAEFANCLAETQPNTNAEGKDCSGITDPKEKAKCLAIPDPSVAGLNAFLAFLVANWNNDKVRVITMIVGVIIIFIVVGGLVQKQPVVQAVTLGYKFNRAVTKTVVKAGRATRRAIQGKKG